MRLQLSAARRPGAVVLLGICAFLLSRDVAAQAPEEEPPPQGFSAPKEPAGEAKERAVRGSVDARTGVYQDSDHTTISTTVITARATIRDRADIEARYLVDVVSSASIDVVTAATGAFRDTRHEASVGGGYHDGTNTFNAGYIFSRENDWQSHTANLGLSRDFLQHNLTLGLGGSFGYNDVMRSGDRNFHRTLLTGGVAGSAAFTPTPRDLVSLSYSVAFLSGYQASPYRYVIFMDAGLRASQPENAPERRTRHALTARWNRHLFRNTALQLHGRAYADDWEVASGTLGAEYLIGVGDFVLAPRVRLYAQRHAGFYRAVYTERLAIMTYDRELSSFFDVFFGASAGWYRRSLGPLEELRVQLKVDGFYFRFFDFPRLEQRYGLVAELALGVSI